MAVGNYVTVYKAKLFGGKHMKKYLIVLMCGLGLCGCASNYKGTQVFNYNGKLQNVSTAPETGDISPSLSIPISPVGK